MSDYGNTPPPPPPGGGSGGGSTPPPPPSGGGYDGGSYGAPPPPSGGYGGAPAGPPPSNYLIPAILSTIFCCLPVGIAAIVFAAQVNGKWNSGDQRGAQESAAKAKKFTIISVVVGLVVAVLYGIAIAAGVMNSDSTTGM
ncbi:MULTISPECIES: CD225/dispanin family protein [unclassified Knoellia]|uniref:CD225/dispanin family protein n=1 Tax=Knoellia altitudinis TaxID=3404795 RepID=UPI00361ECB04